MEALIAVNGRKKSERMLRIMADKLASEENLSQVFHIRPVSEAMQVQAARRGAVKLFDRYLPLFLARLPPK